MKTVNSSIAGIKECIVLLPIRFELLLSVYKTIPISDTRLFRHQSGRSVTILFLIYPASANFSADFLIPSKSCLLNVKFNAPALSSACRSFLAPTNTQPIPGCLIVQLIITCESVALYFSAIGLISRSNSFVLRIFSSV